MDKDSFDKLASLYTKVGEAMLRQTGQDSGELWMYAEAGDGWAGDALFKIGAVALEWIDPETDLANSIMNLWNATDPSKRWVAMEFEIHGTEFKTHFWYEGELPPDETGFERRYELIRRRFGNLKVIYPADPLA